MIGLFFSLVFLAVASVGFTGDPWWLLNEATKWVIAGVVAVVGVEPAGHRPAGPAAQEHQLAGRDQEIRVEISPLTTRAS